MRPNADHQSFPVRTTQTIMFKLVVLCSVVAAAVAKPGLAPFGYGGLYTPTTYAATSPLLATGYSPYIHGAPLLPTASLGYGYVAPSHFIKKRSVALAGIPATSYITPGYSAPLTYSYASTFPAATYSSYPYLTSPYAYSSHYIKKRSAPLAISTYLAPAAVSHQSRFDLQTSGPLVTSYASPYLYSSPLGYAQYFKK